ncbi:MAG: prolyl oligopeptidase family serine peptidase [Planctomycetaceae bacterium]|nr:prolyl oligopeptidase family serine peptidase [Planctomycetaceae bacterium]
MKLVCLAAISFCFTVCAQPLLADGPADNVADNVRRIPKLGIEVKPEERTQLETRLKQLASSINELQTDQRDAVQRYLPDVEVFYWSAALNLKHQEFFRPQEVAAARNHVELGLARAEQLKAGNTPWRFETGAVIRGYRSRIDGSIQPYAVYVPKNYQSQGTKEYRCDLWYHGRGETLSETNFIAQRMRNQGAVSSTTHFMVHPYGRYSNANKFAGEIDTLEVLEHLKQDYRIDDDRIAVRGFSMGGAACWQFAVHYSDRWFAATPGAGFSETPEFLKSFQNETLNPTWYEEKLWRMYDCTDHAVNLYQCPTIAYSGEIDRQKQAADIMEEYLRREGIDMVHIIGPQTAHKIHPDSLVEIERRLSELQRTGRERYPRNIHFTTFTLKYNRMNWVQVDGLGEHWERARVDAQLQDQSLSADTLNVTDITFNFPSGDAPFDLLSPVVVTLDGQQIEAGRPKSDRSWQASFYRDQRNVWRPGPRPEAGLRKVHNLQGPIDDAFMDSFVFVAPTGQAAHSSVDTWTKSEFEHAVVHWRRHFRGTPRVMKDSEIGEAEISQHNLVLFGDPSSNAVLAKIADKLPIQWSKETITAGDRTWDASKHGLIMIFPNPLNPERYVVLNSGFTFREYDYLNNARQVPKLPDWGVVDLSVPPHSRGPGKIVDADFFGENWKLQPPHQER